MPRHLVAFLTFASLAAFRSASACRETENGFDCAQLDEFIAGVMECKKIPGMSVALVKEQDTVLTKGYGLADIDKGIPVGEETLFPIASMTKAFTATLWASLLEEFENISTSTPLRDVLGSWFKLTDDIRSEHITLLDTLSNRAGLNDYNVFLTGFGMNMARDEFIRRLRYGEEVLPFRSDFLYSNQMFTLAGYVAEFIKKSTWESLVQERIFDELDMTASTFCEQFIELEEGVAGAYLYNFTENSYIPLDKKVLSVTNMLSPAGAVVSNAVDMAKWLKFHLARGRNERGEQVVDPDLLTETFYPNSVLGGVATSRPTFPVSSSQPTYASGWINELYRGYLKVNHGGSVGGYNSAMSVFLTGDIGITTLINGPHTADAVQAVHNVHAFAADLLLGEEPWLNVSTACSYPAPWTPPATDAETWSYETMLRGNGPKEHVSSVRSTNDGPKSGASSPVGRQSAVNEIQSKQDFPDSKKASASDSKQGTVHRAAFTETLHLQEGVKFEADASISAAGILHRNFKSTRLLTDYTGTYVHRLLGNLTIFMDNTDSSLHYEYGIFGRGVLHPFPDDTFKFSIDTEMWYKYPDSGMYMRFSSSENEKDDDVIDRVLFPTSGGAVFERIIIPPDPVSSTSLLSYHPLCLYMCLCICFNFSRSSVIILTSSD
ncbi:protein flp-like [Ptychodera flava]|uniref:protein flp-like n=1 Tax=Ptychodera flava TaxID=63121 RepID=UPI003969EF2D